MKMLLKKLLIVFMVILIGVFHRVAYSEESDMPKTSTFNEAWLDAIVSIETDTQILKNGKLEIERVTIGTGFLVGTDNGVVILVTAGHVVRDDKGNPLSNLYYMRTDLSGSASILSDKDMVEAGLGQLFFLDSADVACRYIAPHKSSKPLTFIPISMFLSKTGLQAGAQALVLGYPMGLKSGPNDKPIVRNGIVARVDSDQIILDSFVFPGNSGGPVVYTPLFKVGGPLKSSLINEERLIGLVSQYIPYIDVAYSKQTKRPRVSFEENSGLTRVTPVDKVLELLQLPAVKAYEEKILQLRKKEEEAS